MNKLIIVNNRMQTNYQYECVMQTGDFSDHPEFKPDLTPPQMLELGVFGGKYFNDVAETNEYPQRWWIDAKLCGQHNKYNKKLNFYGVRSGDDLDTWRERCWIRRQDPRGWFEWYCRFYIGRRSEDDVRQIKRHNNYTRHLSTLRRNSEHPDDGKSLRTKQSLLHWAYDPRDLKYYKTLEEQINEL